MANRYLIILKFLINLNSHSVFKFEGKFFYHSYLIMAPQHPLSFILHSWVQVVPTQSKLGYFILFWKKCSLSPRLKATKCLISCYKNCFSNNVNIFSLIKSFIALASFYKIYFSEPFSPKGFNITVNVIFWNLKNLIAFQENFHHFLTLKFLAVFVKICVGLIFDGFNSLKFWGEKK